jgi:hypothetical protein
MTNRAILFILIVTAFVAHADAQELGLHVTATLAQDTGSRGQVWFGLDATANDSMVDKQWFGGEQLIPSLISPGGVDLRMVNRTLNRFYLSADGYDGGYIDIRHKPAADSFMLQYEILLSTSDNGDSMHIVWDKTKIPSIVKHIYISSEALSLKYIRLDMTQQSRFDFPMFLDSINMYHQILVTLLYNEDMLAVKNYPEASGTQAASLYPTIVTGNSPVYLSLKEAHTVSILLYDMTGRKVRAMQINASEGSNELFGLHLTSGMYVAEIRDESKNIILGRQKLIVQ